MTNDARAISEERFFLGLLSAARVQGLCAFPADGPVFHAAFVAAIEAAKRLRWTNVVDGLDRMADVDPTYGHTPYAERLIALGISAHLLVFTSTAVDRVRLLLSREAALKRFVRLHEETELHFASLAAVFITELGETAQVMHPEYAPEDVAAALVATMSTELPVYLLPLLQARGADLVAPVAIYEQIDSGSKRPMEGWTIGTAHNVGPVLPFCWRALLPRNGKQLVLLEGVRLRAADGDPNVRTFARLLRRRGVKAATVENCDVTYHWVMDCEPPDALDVDSPADVVAEHVMDALTVLADPNRAVTGPTRHAPLCARVAQATTTDRRPRRVVIVYGIGHLSGIERDVWTPNGFQLREIRYWQAGRILSAQEMLRMDRSDRILRELEAAGRLPRIGEGDDDGA